MFGILANMLFLFLKLSHGANYPPPLGKEEEKMYFEKCKNGDAEARKILIERNLRLVAHIAKKYSLSGCEVVSTEMSSAVSSPSSSYCR